ncbi:uroporphyrinogen decarboxylase family protein [Candidatus Latescibacterota bacterium]
MSRRDDLLGMLSGDKPDRTPFIFMGFHDEDTTHKLAPADCWDDNTYYIPPATSPLGRFAPEARTDESRERAVRMSRYLDMATVGVGKGGVFPFGHGGPGELQPQVIEQTDEYRILQYEGGHKRRINRNPHSIRYYDFPLKAEADLDRLELPDMCDPERFRDIEADAAYIREAGFVSTGCIQGFFSGIHNSFMEYEDALANLLLKPEFMRDVTERLATMCLDAVDSMLDRGVDVINVCDDLGTAEALILSPELIRGFFFPWYEELVHRIHAKGGYLHLHSHGNIRELMPDFAAMGVDILNPFDWDENPDLPDLVRQHSRDFIFCGGTTGALHEHSVEEVREIVYRACALSELAERGYILLAGGAISTLSHETWEAWMEIFTGARDRAV